MSAQVRENGISCNVAMCERVFDLIVVVVVVSIPVKTRYSVSSNCVSNRERARERKDLMRQRLR